MAEVQIKVEIQDGSGNMQKRAVLAVPEDITRSELVSALVTRYPSLKNERISVLVDWPEDKPASERMVTDDALVIVRPRSSGVRFLAEE